MTQIPGGLLASRYGTKRVFGFSNFSGVVLCFFIPYFAKLGAMYLMALRLVQGLLLVGTEKSFNASIIEVFKGFLLAFNA